MSTNTKVKSISIIENHINPVEEVSLEEAWQLIKEGKYKKTIDEIRNLYLASNSKEATALKLKLPGFTISGIINERRNNNNLAKYSGYLCLDIDDLEPRELMRVKKAAEELPYTVLAFVSPSGFGLKLIVQVNTGKEEHKEAYMQVQSYYEKELDCKCDKTNDVARLCYVSHDPDAYFNEDAEVFQVIIEPVQQDVCHQPTIDASSPEGQHKSTFDSLVTYTNNKKRFEPSNRNSYIYLLSCNCNRHAIPKEVTLKLIISKYVESDFDAYEITKTVNSAYSKTAEFGTWKKTTSKVHTTKLASKSTIEDLQDDTVMMSEDVYLNLPDLLQSILSSITDNRERDVALTANLVLLSSMLPNVVGWYYGKPVYSNLYGLVLAPPANNKGVIKSIHEIYNDITNSYQIPGNSTSTVAMDYLGANNGIGLLCETEADALGYLTNKETESFNQIVNNSFHNEPINIARKSMDQTIWVNKPKLSILLSGIPEQVSSIVKGTHSGIFSRFITYTYNNSYVWKDVSTSTQAINPKGFSNDVANLKTYLKELQSNMVSFEFTQNQWSQLNSHYSTYLKVLGISSTPDMAAVVKRMGLISYRIAMILSVLRCFENGEITASITCTDTDFKSAMQIASVYLQHAEAIYNSMESNKEKLALSSNVGKLYDVLPDEFDRKSAIGIASKNNIYLSDRTIDKYLKQLVTQGLLDYSYNKYSKKAKIIDITQSNNKAA